MEGHGASEHDSAAITSRERYAPTMRERSEARHLPGDVYFSSSVADLEKDKIFMKNWLCVGRVEEVENPGDFLTLRIMNEPVIVVRQPSSEIIALSNVCRHRGVEVAKGSGTVSRFSCPYHAWTYDLSGKLMGAPLMKQTSYDLSECRLPRIHLSQWRGWMFINFQKDPPPLTQALAAFEEKFGFLQSEKCRLGDKLVIDIACNWKFVPENLMDIYHVRVIHAKSFGNTFKGDREKYKFDLMPDGGYGFFFQAAPLLPDAKSLFGKMPWLVDKDDDFACLGFIAPNMNWTARADTVRMWVTWPIAPDRCQLIAYSLYPAEKLNEPGFAEKAKKYSDFLRTVVGEDQEMCESLQNGVAARSFEPGPLALLEESVHHVMTHYIEQITG